MCLEGVGRSSVKGRGEGRSCIWRGGEGRGYC